MPEANGDFTALGTQMTDDEQAIREVINRWMDASLRGDTDAVLGLMTDDIVFTAAGREPFGKEEFRAMSEAMSGAKIDGRADIVELRVLGDWAWLRNHLEISVTSPDGGEPAHRAGYTLSILQRCD